MKQSKGLNRDLKPEHKLTTNKITKGPTTDIDSHVPTIWNRLGRELSFSLRSDPLSFNQRGKQSVQPEVG